MNGGFEGVESRRHSGSKEQNAKEGKKWRREETNRPRDKAEERGNGLDGFLEFLISDIGTTPEILRESGNVNSALSPAGREELTGLL